jgi:putative transposase
LSNNNQLTGYATININSILAFNNKDNVSDVLSELLRNGAQKLIHNALEAELRGFMFQHQGVTEDGNVSIIRNGYLPKRQILTGIGAVSVRIPKVRSKDKEALTFRSALVPLYVRKTKSLEVECNLFLQHISLYVKRISKFMRHRQNTTL